MRSRLSGIGMTSQRTRDRLVQRLYEEGVRNSAVLEVLRQMPRHVFVDEALASRAYEDTALPIGHGQTISQPYIVARMTEALVDTGPLDKVLEVGTGSGYQAAVMAQLAGTVYTVERNRILLEQARARFRLLGLRNIITRYGDGSLGWKKHAPYDAILLTAAPVDVAQSVFEQLRIGGRLIVPIGRQGGQRLVLYTRTVDGYQQTPLEHVSFVPLVGGTV